MTQFEPTKRDKLPLYEFQHRMAIINYENLFAQSRPIIERIKQWNDEVTFDNLASDDPKDE